MFDAALREALEEGYTGLRVAADNTSLIDGAERFEAWGRWEEVAETPITGLCGFDRVGPTV